MKSRIEILKLRSERKLAKINDRLRRSSLKKESLKQSKQDALGKTTTDYSSNRVSSKGDPFSYGRKKNAKLSQDEIDELKRNRTKDYKKYSPF